LPLPADGRRAQHGARAEAATPRVAPRVAKRDRGSGVKRGPAWGAKRARESAELLRAWGAGEPPREWEAAWGGPAEAAGWGSAPPR